MKILATCSLAVAAVLAGPGGAWAQGGGLQPPPAPPGNPVTAEKALLGKALFWDEQLSSTRTVACGSCHALPAGGSDPRTVVGAPEATHPGPDGRFGTPDDVFGSPGVIRSEADGDYLADADFGLRPQVTGRRSMPVINAAYARRLFWDGRALPTFVDPLSQQVVLQRMAALESQVLGPPLSEVEMAHEGRDWNEVAARVAGLEPLALSPGLTPDLANWIAGRDYPALFAEAFGSAEVTPARIAMAIATYERTLFSDQAPIDAFLDGNPNALTPQEQRGFNLFNSPRLACNTCHGGPVFSDDRFHYTGVRPQDEDLGLGGVTGNPGDHGRMKSPSLRNVELRAPYFRNGAAATLEEVVAFYDRGGDFDGPNKAAAVRPLNLTPGERADLLAFLRRPLTDPRVAAGSAPFDAPALYAGSDRQPVAFGVATPGSGGIAPQLIAVEPPLLGNPSLTLGVDAGVGGGRATLVVDRFVVPGGRAVSGAWAYPLGSAEALMRRIRLAGTGAGAGWGSFDLSVPSRASLAGIVLYAQGFVEDAGAPGGVAATRGVELTLFWN